MFSITNFGSLFPDPNGAKLLISLKKTSFNALGEIIESKYKSLLDDETTLDFSKFLIKKSLNLGIFSFFNTKKLRTYLHDIPLKTLMQAFVCSF